MDRFLPVDRLGENQHWVAFYHPQPVYPLHILILPRVGMQTLTAAPLDEPERFTALFALVKELIGQFELEENGYRLITNGGPNQTIPQWHWHLVTGESEEKHA